MPILIAIGLLIVLLATTTVLHYRYTKASEALFAARRDRAKLQARLEAARKAAQDAEGRCTQLMHQVNTSLASTGQALSIARHIEVVRQQMAELLALVGYSDGAHAHEPAVTADEYPPLPLEPGVADYGPRQLPGPVSVTGHPHVNHTQPMPITHPGQRPAMRSA